jgi:SAM-dependent methyltransferase
VTAGTRVLDVACGPGFVAAAALARGARASGVDLSSAMVALATRTHAGLEVRQGDAEALPFPDAVFDAVVCNFGLGHFPRPEVAVREMARVLASGGRLAVSWWNGPMHSRINGAFLDALAIVGAPPPADVPPGPPIFRFSSDAALSGLLGGAGLADVHVQTHTWTYHAPSLEAWWTGGLGGMARNAAAVYGQPPDVQARIRKEFDRVASVYAADAGVGFDIPNSAKLGVGKKR